MHRVPGCTLKLKLDSDGCGQQGKCRLAHRTGDERGIWLGCQGGSSGRDDSSRGGQHEGGCQAGRRQAEQRAVLTCCLHTVMLQHGCMRGNEQISGRV